MLKLRLRLRVAIAFALACSAVVATLGIVLYSASEKMEEDLVDQIVHEELTALVARTGSGRSFPASGPNLQYYVVHDAHDRTLPEALRGLAPGMHEMGEGGDELHVGVRESNGARYIVAYDAGPHELREARFKSLVLFALAGIALASFALGYWLAGILTRQVTDLAQRVGHLEPRGTPAPLAQPGQDPEVTALARALNDYQQRIAAMLAREQEFTTNASHELRTPLTAIATSCELLLEEPALADRVRERVQMIAAAATQMGEQVQTLLFLAREQSPGRAEPVALAECVHDAAAPLQREIARKHLSLEVDVPPDTLLPVNRQALHAVLSNLLRNAVQYTETGYIRVEYRAGVVGVLDSGRGIPADHLPRVFERYYRQAGHGDGLGVGLAIVKRICDHYGWRIEVRSSPGRGSAFTVALS